MATKRPRRRSWLEILAFIAITILLAAAISIGYVGVCRIGIDVPSQNRVTPVPGG